MPTYYNQVLGLDLMKSGFYSVLPWITMALAANVGGWVADSMVARGVSVTRVRKIMQSVRAAEQTHLHQQPTQSSLRAYNDLECLANSLDHAAVQVVQSPLTHHRMGASRWYWCPIAWSTMWACAPLWLQ